MKRHARGGERVFQVPAESRPALQRDEASTPQVLERDLTASALPGGNEEIDEARQQRLERDAGGLAGRGAPRQRKIDLPRAQRLEQTRRRPLEHTDRERAPFAEEARDGARDDLPA